MTPSEAQFEPIAESNAEHAGYGDNQQHAKADRHDLDAVIA
jgi:hypothetical protein